MFNYLLLPLLVSFTLADNVPPLCVKCSCENDADNHFGVTCNNLINNIFDQSYWMSDKNESYLYKTVKIHNSLILNLDKSFPPSNITYMNLANNSIFNISEGVFKNLQNMETLILSYNNIEVLHPEAFKGVYTDGDFEPLRSLKYLHLGYNKIHSLDGDIFEHTSRVEFLDLSHNPFKIIDAQTLVAITSLVYLRKLDLSYTELKMLPDYFLHTPKYLNFLDLSGNLFDRIPATLGDSHNLTVLYFNNNPMISLNSTNGFPNIPTLKSLHLCNMRHLVNISEGALSNLGGLEELYCFGNPELSYIDQKALSAKRDGENSAETWPPIKKLYLQDNRLTRLDIQLVLDWKLLELDLTNNPWTCECENEWIVDELMPIYEKLDLEKAKEMKCAAPIEMTSTTFYEIYRKQTSMRCLDRYGNRPERDGVLLVGILAGVLITIPLVLFLIYAYQRHWFGLFDGSPAGFSRQFYKRTVSEDGYF